MNLILPEPLQNLHKDNCPQLRAYSQELKAEFRESLCTWVLLTRFQ